LFPVINTVGAYEADNAYEELTTTPLILLEVIYEAVNALFAHEAVMFVFDGAYDADNEYDALNAGLFEL
jgi:hypothetical protein